MRKIYIPANNLFTNKKFIHTSIIVTIGFIIYSNTFNVPFHFDDYSNIVNNLYIRDLSRFWPPQGSRWFGNLTFALNYHFHGLNVVGYHVVNLLIHITNAIMVYFLAFYTFKTPFLKIDDAKLSNKSNTNEFIALSSGSLFVSHPIQTQAVTYIVQRFTSLATLLYLLSLLMYVKARFAWIESGKDKNERKYYFPPIIYYILSIISTILAMMTKEISFTIPFIIVLYELYLFRMPGHKKNLIMDKKKLYPLIPFILTLLIIPSSVIKVSRPMNDILGEINGIFQGQGTVSQGIYLLTQFRVIVTYIRLLFLPVNQNLDYDYPLSYSLFEIQTFISFLFILTIIGIAIYLLKRSRRTDNIYLPLISFGIVWFYITLSLTSSIIPNSEVIHEHRLYLPSIGIAITFSSVLLFASKIVKERLLTKSIFSVAIVMLIVITAILSIATYKRNIIWKDELTLLEDIVRKSPKKARVHNNLGNVYGGRGLIDKAIEHYHIALRLKPDYAEAYNNLGEAYKSKGLYDKAIEHYLIAIKLRPDFAEAYNNLGVVYSFKKEIDKGIENFLYAIGLKYEYAEAHNNLGAAYKSKSMKEKAIEHYRIALKLRPDFIKARLNLGIIYLQGGDIESAQREFETALKINPDDLFVRHFLDSISTKK